MKKHLRLPFLVLFFFSLITCKSQSAPMTCTIPVPENYKVLAETEGDLDLDGIAEKVVVYHTDKETDLGMERRLYIYKKENDQWVLWKQSAKAVLASEHGGMMGNPFEGISIERNCIVINHYGGSRIRWHYTHRYRFQDGDFRLIGATVTNIDACIFLMTFDYNLSTGNITYENETIDCETDESQLYFEDMILKPDMLPSMENFYPGNNKVDIPHAKTSVYY